ncbi:T9SS type A sorting domain-containing protein, partial [bacterium]|nr:T9SS type A sorting domain-containing protein [bacterium]
FTIYAYGENDWVALPGFVDGNPMYFRIWSPSEAAEFIAEPTFSEGEGIFQWREQNTLTLEALDGPVLNFDDSPYNFGEVDANTTAEYELLLTNTGIPDLELTDILSSDPRFVPEFTEMTIPGGSSETLTIYFTPEGETLYASELTFSSNVPLFADFSVDLFGTGVGGGGVIITVPLQANYFELVSTHVQPLNLDAANVFDLEDLVIVYDHVGGILFPPDINTIGDIVVTRGYQIFVTSPQIWDLIGVQIDPLTEYTIHRSTWNWIGYPFNFPMPVTEGMADIEDQVSIVISDDGRLWVPHLGINTMGDLLPGEGYMVFSQDDDVTFQYGQNQLLANNPGNDYTPIIEAPDAPPATGKPYAVLVNMTDHLRELNPAIIEVYDGGLLVGKSLVSDDEYTPVIAWEGSPEHDLAGFKKGNPISVQVLDATGNLLSTCEPAVFQNRSGHHFGEGPYANMQLELIQSDQSDLPSEFTVGGAYPNPFNATLTVPFSLPVRGNVTLSLFNTLGQEIFTNSKSYNAGEHRFTFEGNEYGSGVFFLRVSSGTMTLTQKVMLLR